MTGSKSSVLFVCVHNVGPSQMAAAYLTRLGREPVRSARSATRFALGSRL